jgi:hypothetical protein
MFRDDLSRKEHGISGMCQACQDEMFHDPDCDDPRCEQCFADPSSEDDAVDEALSAALEKLRAGGR